MKLVFADTGFWIAVVDPFDQLHAKADRLWRVSDFDRLVTSQMVLMETLNSFSKKPRLRRLGIRLVDAVYANTHAEVVPQSSDQFFAALALYRQREDKQWSLPDCASFQIMWERGITDALTHDHHFRQAGFKPLLRDD